MNGIDRASTMTPLTTGGGGDETPNNLTAAADLIRQLDTAFSDMSSFAVTAAKDAEEARKNARVASELARRFSSGSSSSSSSSTTHVAPAAAIRSLDTLHELNDEIPAFSEPLQPPPAPPDSPFKSPQKSTSPKSNRSSYYGGSRHSSSPGSETPHSRRMSKSAERLAQTHAEDLLGVTLELERTKQKLESEQMSHDETKSALQQARSKNTQLEAQIEKLLADMETARYNSGNKIDQLEHEVQQANLRADAADEDAKTALDLARMNASNRQAAEEWVQRANEEIQMLREYIATETAGTIAADMADSGGGVDEQKSSASSTTKHVRFAEDEEEESPPRLMAAHHRPSRALVAAGRQLLHRAFSGPNDSDAPLTVSRSNSEEFHERRERLRERLQRLGVAGDIHGDGSGAVVQNGTRGPAVHSPARRTNQHNRDSSLGRTVEALDVCRNAAAILKESGSRLNLTGRWWNNSTSSSSSNTASPPVLDEIHLETLTRHYTAQVEVQLNRKHKEVLELESFCSLLEEGITGREVATNSD